MRSIRLPAAWAGELRRLADAAYPLEACGLIVGRNGAAERLVPCANVAEAPRRHFEVDPAALLACHRRARETGEAILAVYHSHPDGAAAPSPTDAAMAHDRDLVWLVIAGGGGRAGEICAWRPQAEGFTPVELIWREGSGA